MIIGLDISTSCIGICILGEDGKLIELTHIKMGKKYVNIAEGERYIHKAEDFRIKMEEIRDKYLSLAKELNDDNYMIRDIWVEEPLQRSNNVFTVNILQSFNGICRYILYKVFNKTPNMVNERVARANFLPEYCRIESDNIENPDIFEFILKEGIEFPSKIKTFSDKYTFIKKKYPSLELKKYIAGTKTVFSYPKELDIKQYIFNKVISIYGDMINTIYMKSGKVDTSNYDMTDAYVVALYGYISKHIQ